MDVIDGLVDERERSVIDWKNIVIIDDYDRLKYWETITDADRTLYYFGKFNKAKSIKYTDSHVSLSFFFRTGDGFSCKLPIYDIRYTQFVDGHCYIISVNIRDKIRVFNKIHYNANKPEYIYW